jgi:glycosyltransferase involved in cell wall biosynthesis
MTGGGLVSVIIPVFNGARFLAPALESALAQEYKPFEVIVVDDGSTDATPEVAGSFPEVHYLRQPNSGPAAARNAGIRVAHGEFIAFLDADDLLPPGKLQLQVGYLVDHPEVGCVLGRQEVMVEPGVEFPSWLREPAAWMAGWASVVSREHVQPVSMVARRRLFDEVGLFDPRFLLGEDVDLVLRVIDARIPLVILPEVVQLRRIHGANLSYDTVGTHRAIFQVLKARIDRKRAIR